MKTRLLAALMAAVLLPFATIVGTFADTPALQNYGALTGVGSVGVRNLTNQSTCSTTISGSWSGTVTFEGEGNGPSTGSSYNALPDTGTYSALNTTTFQGGTAATTASSNGLYLTPVAGLTGFRARVSSYTSGTVNITVFCTGGVYPGSSSSGGGSGATPIPYPTATSAPNALQVHNDGSFGGGAAPTPIPTPAGGVYPVSPSTTFPVSGAFPTPLAVQPISGAPTPIPPAYNATNAQTATSNSFMGAACVYNGASPTLTAGQVQACLTDVSGNQLVNLITSLPIGTNSIGTVGLNTGSNTIGAVNLNAPYTMATASPQTGLANSAIGVAGQYIAASVAGSNGQIFPLQTNIYGYLRTVLCGGTSTSCATIQSMTDAQANLGVLEVGSFGFAYDGTNSDRIRKDTYAAGPQWMTIGGSANTAIAAGTAGPTVIKSSAGRLSHVLVTTAGTTSEAWYDNATTCSGTIIGITPATTTVGQVLVFDTVAVNGITACGASGTSPATTSSYY
jgi:hypothetical protein